MYAFRICAGTPAILTVVFVVFFSYSMQLPGQQLWPQLWNEPFVYRKREIKSSFKSTGVLFGILVFLTESEGGRLVTRSMQEFTWYRTKCGVDFDCVSFRLDIGTEITSCAVGPSCSSVEDQGRLTLLPIWGCVVPHRFAELHQCWLYFRFCVRRLFLRRYCQFRTTCRWASKFISCFGYRIILNLRGSFTKLRSTET